MMDEEMKNDKRVVAGHVSRLKIQTPTKIIVAGCNRVTTSNLTLSSVGCGSSVPAFSSIFLKLI